MSVHPCVERLIETLEELSHATEPVISRVGSHTLITLGPAANGAMRLGLRTDGDWVFVSVGDLDGGLEFGLADATDQVDLVKMCVAIAMGAATIEFWSRRSKKRFAGLRTDDGLRMRASVGGLCETSNGR